MMAEFLLTAPDGAKYKVSADDENAAVAAFKKMFPPEPDYGAEHGGRAGAAVRGFVDTATFGFPDEIAGVVGGAIDAARGRSSFSEGYKRVRDNARRIDESDKQNRPGYRLAGQVAGGVAGAAGLTGAGLSLSANAARTGYGLGRVAAASAADGAIAGGLYGAGGGTDAASRGKGAVAGGVVGGALGAAAPVLVAGASAALQPIIAPIMSRLRPQNYANAALGEGVRRSGLSVDDIVNQLDDAQRAGQGVYTVADALGNSGQRMLSTAARNPHDARQAIVDALMSRQAGQGRRIATALSEGFDAPVTATQRSGALTGARNAAADIGYDAARNSAGMVNVSGALNAADNLLAPGASRLANPASTLADDSIEAAVRRVRGLLGNGREQLADFSAALRAKQEIDDMIGAAVRSGANNKARLLGEVRDQLDTALEASSAPYAAARDAYREGSRSIEAVQTGRQAAMRGRPEDTTEAFARMTPDEQAAFRVGYADPLIESTQTAATGVNKARPLINDATAVEFPAFAAPGRAGQLGERLAREQRMFETNNIAMGGSRTADNLADAAEMSKFDSGVMANLLRGRPIQAAIDGVTRLINESRGMPPRVIESIARTLMETRPDVARTMLEQAQGRTVANAGRQALVTAILRNLGAAGGGGLLSPAQ